VKSPSVADIPALLKLLVDGGVEFIVVGGVAGVVNGAARVTFDLDVVYRRTIENIARLARALDGHSPYLRGVPLGLPFIWDEKTISAGLNFTLDTDLGSLDLLGEIAGGGQYESLIADTFVVEAYGLQCACVTLDKLIELKTAAGRPKDLEAIAELESLREERQQPPRS